MCDAIISLDSRGASVREELSCHRENGDRSVPFAVAMKHRGAKRSAQKYES